MQLEAYLRESGITKADFARTIDVDWSTLFRYMRGIRRPHPDILYRIVKATGGAVQANDFYAPPSVNQITPGE